LELSEGGFSVSGLEEIFTTRFAAQQPQQQGKKFLAPRSLVD